MYPVGSNGASQAILDARALADRLVGAEHPLHALWAYEQERLPPTAQIVRMNRSGGPEGVIDAVEARAPDGFTNIDAVLSYEERKAIVRGYAETAGFAREQVNRAAAGAAANADAFGTATVYALFFFATAGPILVVDRTTNSEPRSQLDRVHESAFGSGRQRSLPRAILWLSAPPPPSYGASCRKICNTFCSSAPSCSAIRAKATKACASNWQNFCTTIMRARSRATADESR